MEKLASSKYPPKLIILAVINIVVIMACLALMVFVLPRISEKVYVFPLWILILSECLLALAAILILQLSSIKESLQNLRPTPAFASIGLLFFVAAIGVLFSPISRLDQNGFISFGLGQLLVMNIGMITSILILENMYNLSHLDFVDGKANLTKDLSKSVDSYVPTPEETTSDHEVITQKSTEKSDMLSQIRRLPSSEARKSQSRITDPHKKMSKTVAKLQALSASGTGSVQLSPASSSTAHQSGLRSVLDRLDEEQAPSAPQSAQQEEVTPGIFSKAVDTEVDAFFDQIVSSQPSIETKLSEQASAEIESSTPPGPVTAAGEFLIDPQSMEDILKRADAGKVTIDLPSARIISTIQGKGIQTFLQSIDEGMSSAGSMLVGHDGLVIASTFTTSNDREGVGALVHGLMRNSYTTLIPLDLGKLEQMIIVSKTDDNDNKRQMTTTLTETKAGVIGVFLEKQLVSGLDQLLDKISTMGSG